MSNSAGILDYGIELAALQLPTSVAVQRWLEKHRLSWLHAKVICGDVSEVLRLLMEGGDPNAADWHLWTPLHHAALRRDTSMIALLLAHGANASFQNDYGGTYQHVLRLVTPPNERFDPKLAVFFKDAAIGLTSREYEKLTKTLYVDEDYISASAMLALWHVSPALQTAMHKDSLSSYQQWRASLRMSTDTFSIASASPVTMENGVELAGLGLFAKRVYAPFEVVGEYFGAVEDTKGNYVLQAGNVGGKPFKIDAGRYSNEMSRINDGFPNLFLTALGNDRGLPCRPILVALVDVPVGEQFCFNYGWHTVKKGPYVELRPQALREFMLKYNLQDWTSTLAKVNPFDVDQISLSDIAFLAQFRYLLQTPKALCALLLDGTIDKHKATAMIATAGEGHIPAEDFAACHALIDVAGQLAQYLCQAQLPQKLIRAKRAIERLAMDEATKALQSLLSDKRRASPL